MCGRFTNSATAAELERRLDLEHVPERVARRYNVAPGQQVLGIVSDGDGRHAELLHWGLVPSWAKDPKVGYRMINARSETVTKKRSYRQLVDSSTQRALIVADGFYEWLAPEDRKAPKTPMHFSLATGLPFMFAALWTTWRSAQGDQLSSTTILTTTPNPIVAPVHDRMPVILADEDAQRAWLDPDLDGPLATQLLRPLPSFLMKARPASPLVNSARNEGPELLEAPLVLPVAA